MQERQKRRNGNRKKSVNVLSILLTYVCQCAYDRYIDEQHRNGLNDMNNQPKLIQMMNEKLDQMTARGIPVSQAKLMVAMAMIETLRKCGISESDVMKFAGIVTK